MHDYVGTVTVSATRGRHSVGDMGAGSGRVVPELIGGARDRIGFGSAYFGNTAVGSPVTLTRIFV